MFIKKIETNTIHQEQDENPIDPNCVPVVKYLHLFPTFDEIELGVVPNSMEVARLTRVGIPLEMMYPQYFLKSYNREDILTLSQNEKEFSYLEGLTCTVDDSIFMRSANSETSKQKDNEDTLSTFSSKQNEDNIQQISPSASLNYETVQQENSSGNHIPDELMLITQKDNLEISLTDKDNSQLSTNESCSQSNQKESLPTSEYIEELNISDSAKKPLTLVSCPPFNSLVSTAHVVKPPPGFENIKPDQSCIAQAVYHYDWNLYNRTRLPAAPAPPNMLPNQSVMTNHPPLFNNMPMHNIPFQSFQQFGLRPNYRHPYNPNNFFHPQIPPQSIYVNQQHSDNPFLPNYEETYCNQPFSNIPYNSPSTYQNVIAHQQKQLMRDCLHHIIKQQLLIGNEQVLHHFKGILRQQTALINSGDKIMSEALLEILMTTPTQLPSDKLEAMFTDILKSFGDESIIELSKIAQQPTRTTNATTHNVTSNSPQANNNEVLHTAMNELNINTSHNSEIQLNKSNETHLLNTEKYTEILNKKNDNTDNKKLIIKKDLNGCLLNIIRLDKNVYVMVNEIVSFIKEDLSLHEIRKRILMSNSSASIVAIKFSDHEKLAQEMSKDVIIDQNSILQLIPVSFVPEFLEILGYKHTFANFEEFLKQINYNSHLWI